MNKLRLFSLTLFILLSLFCYTSFIGKVIGSSDNYYITETAIPKDTLNSYKSLFILFNVSVNKATGKHDIFKLVNQNDSIALSYNDNAVTLNRTSRTSENTSLMCVDSQKSGKFEMLVRQNGNSLIFECNKKYIGTFSDVANKDSQLSFYSLKSSNINAEVNSFSVTYFKVSQHHLLSVLISFLMFLLFTAASFFLLWRYEIKYSRYLLIWSLLLILFSAWHMACTYAAGYDSPFHDIFIQSSYLFSDFTDYINQMKYLFGRGFFAHEGRVPFILNSGAVSIYLFFMYILHSMNDFAVYFFISATVLSILTLTIYSIRDTASSSFFYFISILALILLSYPVLFTLQRGNTEGLVFASVFLALLLHMDGRDYSAASLIGFAASVKIFPIIFIFIFIYKKLWKHAVFTVFSSVAISVVCLFCIDYNVLGSAAEILRSMAWYNADYNMKSLAPSEMRFYHSYFAVLKDLGSIFLYSPSHDYTVVYRYYFAFSAVFMPMLLFRGYFLKQSSQFVLLSVMMMLFAPMSADYRLLYILIPAIIILKHSITHKISTKLIITAVVPIILILLPTSQISFNDIPLNPFIKNIALNILLFSVVICNNIPDINILRGKSEVTR